MSIKPGSRLNHYEILEPVGRGGMGEVYRARDTMLGRDVAVKVLPDAVAGDRERVDRFEREARLLAAMNHRNIATLHGLERDGSVRFLVMELVEGEDLAARIARGPMPLEEALAAFRQIASALEAAHEKGIVHRDLKPANVKLLPNGEVKVLDFGLAKAFGAEMAGSSAASSPTLTRDGTKSGVLLGTAAYMSPEQARGETVDRRTDIWAFGCCLYEALTGKSAFGGRSVADTLAQILKHEPSLVGPTAPVKNVLERCLRKDLEHRLGSMNDVRTELDNAHTGRSSAGKIAPRIRLAALLAAAVALAAVTWVALHRRDVIVVEIDGNIRGPFDLSPDGTTIVHRSDVSGEGLLYLRPIEATGSAPIPGTTDGFDPVFSPDGQWIVYYDEQVLKKVSLRGGLPIVVSDSVVFGGRGRDWGDDGTIVAVGGALGPLYRVPSGGGDAERLTRLDPQRGELAHLWPEILPGSEWVLFTSLERFGFDNPVVAQSLVTRERREILRGGTSTRYTNGYLVYAHSDTLFAVRFDLEKLEVEGSPVPIPVEGGVETVDADGRAHFRVAANGTLAYRPAPRRPRQWLAWYRRDGSSERLEIPDLNERLSPGIEMVTPRLSPDGRYLAVSLPEVPGGNGRIWLYDLERVSEVPFSDEESAGYLEWSPSGDRLAYAAVGRGGYEVVVRSSSRPSEATTVLRSPSYVLPLDWLSSGEGLLLQEIDRDATGNDITLLEPLTPDSTRRAVLRTVDHEENARLSPDGSLLAYVLNERGRNIFVCTFPDVESPQRVSPDGGSEPRWSPDGTELYFKNLEERELMVVDVTREPELRISEPRVLFSGYFPGVPTGAAHYDISPDGERFLMVVSEDLPTPESKIIVDFDWLDRVEGMLEEAESGSR